MKPLTESDVTFTISIEPEYDRPEDHFASGDDAQDAKDCANIRKQLDDGNQWAWCAVTVTASWNGLEGHDHLGACSYSNEKDFKQPGGYYDDMKREALADLNAKLAKLQRA